MEFYASKKVEIDAARVDVDIVAFHVGPEDVEMISEFLIQEICNRSLTVYGISPEEIE